MNLSSKHLRSFGIATDRFGIDPLLDRVVPKIQSIANYTNYTVQQDERGAPDLISLRAYGTQDLWWHILIYNGIAMYKDIVEGMIVRIPEYGSIISVMTTSELSTRNIKVARV